MCPLTAWLVTRANGNVSSQLCLTRPWIDWKLDPFFVDLWHNRKEFAIQQYYIVVLRQGRDLITQLTIVFQAPKHPERDRRTFAVALMVVKHHETMSVTHSRALPAASQTF